MPVVSKRKRNKVMKFVINFHNNKTDPNRFISCSSMNKYKPFKRINVLDTVRKLVAMGYIEIISKPPHTAKDPAVDLTLKGQCYFEVERDEFWKDVRTKAIIPIIVAFLTTIITLIIANVV